MLLSREKDRGNKTNSFLLRKEENRNKRTDDTPIKKKRIKTRTHVRKIKTKTEGWRVGKKPYGRA